MNEQVIHYMLLAVGILGSVAAYIAGRRVAMTAMPQMIALFNGMGGGAAAGDRSRPP